MEGKLVSPPGQELLGVITSHGPSRESYSPSRKSRGTAAAIALSAADAALPAERVRATISSAAGVSALLQRGMPGGGAEMVAPESPSEISGNGGGPTKTKRSKPPLSGTRQKPENTRAGSSWRPREGNHYRTFFSTIPATGPAATKDSHVCGEVLCNASARMTAGAHWSASGNGSGAGNRRAT